MVGSSYARAVVAGALVLGGLAGCNGAEGLAAGGDDAQEPARQLGGGLTGGGASSQEPAQQAWQAGFADLHPDVEVTYEAVGSDQGLAGFLAEDHDLAATETYLTRADLTAARHRCSGSPVEVPVYVSPVAVVFNLPDLDSLDLDAETLAAVFAGRIPTWDDPAIAALNPEADLPDTEIVPVHRADEAAVTASLTGYLADAGGHAWPWAPGADWPVVAGEEVEGTAGMVAAVESSEGAIGYTDESQAGVLGRVAVQVGQAFVAPSAAGAASALATARRLPGRPRTDLALELDHTPADPDAYPVLLASYLIACSRYDDPAEAELVRAFLTYVLSTEGQEASAAQAGSAPLDPRVVVRALRAVGSISAR